MWALSEKDHGESPGPMQRFVLENWEATETGKILTEKHEQPSKWREALGFCMCRAFSASSA